MGTILRRSGAAIAAVLGLLYLPMIASLMLPEGIRGTIQTIGPMMAGLSVQATVARADSVPIGSVVPPRRGSRVGDGQPDRGALAHPTPRRVAMAVDKLTPLPYGQLTRLAQGLAGKRPGEGSRS